MSLNSASEVRSDWMSSLILLIVAVSAVGLRPLRLGGVGGGEIVPSAAPGVVPSKRAAKLVEWLASSIHQEGGDISRRLAKSSTASFMTTMYCDANLPWTNSAALRPLMDAGIPPPVTM